MINVLLVKKKVKSSNSSLDCYASINDLPIKEADRKFFWPLGGRPDDHAGLSDLGL